jgi:hypothetical protein
MRKMHWWRKRAVAELVNNSLILIARELAKSFNFADYSPNCSPMLNYHRMFCTNIAFMRPTQFLEMGRGTRLLLWREH